MCTNFALQLGLALLLIAHGKVLVIKIMAINMFGLQKVLIDFNPGYQAQNCDELYLERFKKPCSGDFDRCPPGTKKEHEETTKNVPQCYCVRVYTPEEARVKKSCACDNYLDTCLDKGDDGYEASCGFASERCSRKVVSAACKTITDHKRTTYRLLCGGGGGQKVIKKTKNRHRARQDRRRNYKGLHIGGLL